MVEKHSVTFNFEGALQELESIVKSMEEGNLSLEESLKYFEKGVNITRQCQSALKEAEQKVQILTGSSGNSAEPRLQNYKTDIENTVKTSQEQ